jgi:GNAT superfamily N-acetyltransferase
MTPADAGEVRPITTDDRPCLSRFSCRSWGQPWTDDVEASIHVLADELEHTDSLIARGVWVADALVAVAVWRIVPQTPLCESLVLAVQTGHRRRGYARRLKQLELDEARRAGCSVVISKVHWDNGPMMGLNRSLGANVERISDDPDYAYCLIRL